MKNNKIFIILGTILSAFCVLLVYLFGQIAFQNYYDAKKLIKSIKNQDIITTEEIIQKNPECINTYPSITSRGWQSATNLRVSFPLNEACYTGNEEMITLLLENGADPNCNDGVTPLSIAYRMKVDNWYHISLILIENGASLDYTTEYNGNISSILCDIVQVRFRDLVEEYKTESESEVIKAFNYALENCDHSKINWMRVLQHSVTNDRIEIVKLLLDQGYCDVNDTSVGMTALMFAARDSSPEMVQLLLDYGADKNIQSSDKKTAYDYAVRSNNEDIISILETD